MKLNDGGGVYGVSGITSRQMTDILMIRLIFNVWLQSTTSHIMLNENKSKKNGADSDCLPLGYFVLAIYEYLFEKENLKRKVL